MRGRTKRSGDRPVKVQLLKREPPRQGTSRQRFKKNGGRDLKAVGSHQRCAQVAVGVVPGRQGVERNDAVATSDDRHSQDEIRSAPDDGKLHVLSMWKPLGGG